MTDIKHILENLHQYMFLNNNDAGRYSKESSDTFFSPAVKETTNEDNNIFIPAEHDKLFWCFYIMKYGMDKYKSIDQSHFKIETTFKISTAEDLANQEILLKQNKLKKPEIENELVNEKKISMKGLHALCIINKINILFIFNKTFYNMHGLSDDKPFIIEKRDDVYGVIQDITESKKNKVLHNFYEIEDYRKQIKGISAYKVDEIKSIANKLDIKLAGHMGNKKTKKQLYEEIITKL